MPQIPPLMPQPRCDRCNHFRLWDGYPGDYPEGWGLCSRITSETDPEEPTTKAVVHQQWESDGILAVAPDFGCVQYEPKEDQP
jgi:hypothetical protein